MRTLSDHIFDLAQNSVSAGAGQVSIIVVEDLPENLFKIEITDDGKGIRPENIERVKDPFFTSRSAKKRRVGLGISLMDATCQRSGGGLVIDSEHRRGVRLTAVMEHDHTDRPPLGPLVDIFASLMISSAENKIKWTLAHHLDGKSYELKNRPVLEELKALAFSEPGLKPKLVKLIEEREKNLGS